MWRLLLGALVVLVGRYYPAWRFAHMTAAEHVEAAKVALEDQSLAEVQRHLNQLAPGAPEAVDLRKKLAAAQSTQRKNEAAAQQEAAGARLARELTQEAQRVATRELELNLRNRDYEVTVTQSGNTGEIIIASKGFDDPDQRERFLTFLRGENSPAAAACVAGIQAVRLKAPGLFFSFSDKYSLDCYMR